MRTIVLDVPDLDQISEELRQIGTDAHTLPGPAKRCVVLAEILENGNGILEESIATEIKNILRDEELIEGLAAKLENRKTWWAEQDDFTDSNTPEP